MRDVLNQRIIIRLCRRFSICLCVILIGFGQIPIHAQDTLPPPHLGYGIHIAPNTNLDPALVNGLGVDWVKVYDLGQAQLFPDKHILFRLDLTWPDNWSNFRTNVASFASTLINKHIDAVEIGNEPNLVNEWTRGPNAWEYVQMLRVAYTSIKSVNPNIIVVSAGLAPTLTTPDRKAINDLDFAKEMLDNGAAQWFDAFGYHPYGYNLPPDADPSRHELVFRRVERIRALLEAHNVYKQVWLTEFGWLRNPAEDGVTCSDTDPDFAGFAWLRVSSQQQADYLVQAFQYADQNWPWVGPMFVWNLNWHQQTWLTMCNNQRWFSLLKLNGQPTLAYYKLQAMEHRPSDYLPHLELKTESMSATVALNCLYQFPLGKFTITNTGYPLVTPITVSPANGVNPPFVDVNKKAVRLDDPITVFVNPTGLTQTGDYPVYINIKTTTNGQTLSQNMQGLVTVVPAKAGC